MDPTILKVLQVGDFDSAAFEYDPLTRKIKLVSTDANVDGALVYVAGAVISGDKALMFQGDGTVVHADPTSLTYVYAGISLTAGQPGDNVSVQKDGPFSTTFWQWQFGKPVFTAPAGNLTQTVPQGSGFSHIIGRAIGALTVLLKAEDPIQM